MAEHGGYRKPANPAPVSGPGKYSKRTDGKPGETMKQAKQYLSGGGEYGASKELNDIASGADFAAGPDVSNTPVVAFNTPTLKPDEPVTEGAAVGPGRTSLRLYPNDPEPALNDDEVTNILHTAYEADPSIELLYAIKRWENR